MGVTNYHSWSFTRSKNLNECPRMAFFEYYAKNEPESNEAWRLKELQTMPMMAGQVVDYIIALTLKGYRDDGEVKKNLAKAGRKHYRQSIAESEKIIPMMRLQPRTKEQRAESEYSPLHDHYHNLDLGDEYRQSLEDRVAKCLDNFEQGEVWQRLQDVGVSNWGPITKLQSTIPKFKLDGTTVYSNFDMWIKDDGAVIILDWKSGNAGPMAVSSAEGQLAVYALYATSKMKQKRDIKTQAIWLSDSAEYNPMPIADQAIEDAKTRIKSEVASELAKLQVEQLRNGKMKYTAHRDDYQAVPQTKRCCECKFHTICVEGKVATAHLRR